MIKEYLEAFESIMKIYGATNSLEGTYNYFLIIKKALQRLEAIDNANPSEALECFEVINNYGCGINDNMKFSEVFEKEYTTIKQALLKAQKEHKALEIIKPLCEVVETPVKKIRYLKINGVVVYTFKNEEELNLLKEVLE